MRDNILIFVKVNPQNVLLPFLSIILETIIILRNRFFSFLLLLLQAHAELMFYHSGTYGYSNPSGIGAYQAIHNKCVEQHCGDNANRKQGTRNLS